MTEPSAPAAGAPREGPLPHADAPVATAPERWQSFGMPHWRAGRDLSARLHVERLAEDLFRGTCEPGAPGRIFGGQVVGQALVSAGASVSGRPVHSVHAAFLRPGNPDQPVRYRVEPTRDGRSFSTRRVSARQDETVVLDLLASFHHPEAGPHLLPDPPEVPGPEGLPGTLAGSLEMRVVPRQAPGLAVWLRSMTPMPDDDVLRAAALAYATDMMMVGSVQFSRGLEPFGPWRELTASLDHGMHLHAPVRWDGWLLHHCPSGVAAGGRGLASGRVYEGGGRLIASTRQEMLLRTRPS